MATSDLESLAGMPKKASGGGTTTEMQSLKDQIELNRAIASDNASGPGFKITLIRSDKAL